MERIRLSKNAKKVLRYVTEGNRICPESMFASEFSRGARELARAGLLHIHEEAQPLLVAELTDSGRLYLEVNPRLRNPIDWHWVITTTIAGITAIATLCLLFVACKRW